MPITHQDFLSDQDLLADQRLAELNSISWISLQKKISREVGKAKKVLEVGCGLGDFLQQLNRVQNHQVYGIEPNRRAASIAEKKGIILRSQIAEFQSQFFDAIFCFEYLENIFDTKIFMQEVLRILKPGGRFYLSFQNLASFGNRMKLLGGATPLGVGAYLEDYYGHRVRHYTPSKIMDLLKNTFYQKECFDVLEILALPRKNKSILSQSLGLVIPAFSSHCLLSVIKKPI